MEEALTNTISGGINFTGLGSGTDFNKMIEQMVQIERRRVARLELWKSEWDEKVEAFQELQSAMKNLETNLASMNSLNKFFAKSTASSNTSVLTVSANSDAEEGIYNIQVGALAQNHIIYSDNGFDSRDDVIKREGDEGNIFSYTYQGKKVTLEIPDEATLHNFVNIINTDPRNPGIRASIINQGDKHYLQLRGMDQGSDNEITINPETQLTVFYDETEKFTTSQVAQNAKIKIDGWPADDQWIERKTNSFSDIIDGVTMNLYDTGNSQITIANDHEAIKEQIYSFIDQVNEVLTVINSLTKVSSSGQGSLLTGNYGLQMIQARIKNVMANIGIGFDRQVGGDTYPVLSTIGIRTDADTGSVTFGLLKIDEEELNEALNNDPLGVAELISGNVEPDVTSSDFRFGSLVDGLTKPGIYSVRYEVGEDGKLIRGSTFIGGYRARIDGNEITAMEGGARGLSILLDNFTPGKYKGNVRLKSGKVNEMIDALKELTDTSDGTLNILEKNYNDIIKNIDTKIEFEERRIARMERDMRMRFARLEALLGRYDGLQSSLSSQIQSLNDAT